MAGWELRFVKAGGDTIEEQRAYVRSTPLYQLGDARLLWVNESDLCDLARLGVAIIALDEGLGDES